MEQKEQVAILITQSGKPQKMLLSADNEHIVSDILAYIKETYKAPAVAEVAEAVTTEIKEWALKDTENLDDFFVQPECAEGKYLLYLEKLDTYFFAEITSVSGWWTNGFSMTVIETYKQVPYCDGISKHLTSTSTSTSDSTSDSDRKRKVIAIAEVIEQSIEKMIEKVKEKVKESETNATVVDEMFAYKPDSNLIKVIKSADTIDEQTWSNYHEISDSILESIPILTALMPEHKLFRDPKYLDDNNSIYEAISTEVPLKTWLDELKILTSLSNEAHGYRRYNKDGEIEIRGFMPGYKLILAIAIYDYITRAFPLGLYNVITKNFVSTSYNKILEFQKDKNNYEEMITTMMALSRKSKEEATAHFDNWVTYLETLLKRVEGNINFMQMLDKVASRQYVI